MRDNKKWRLIHRKDGGSILVVFEHTPNKKFSSGCFNDADANLWAAEKYHQETGLGDAPSITLGEFAKDFFKSSDPRGFRKRTEARGYKFSETEWQRRQRLLDNFILPAHGDREISTISDVSIEDMILNLKSVRFKGEDLSNDVKNRVLTAYSDIMKEAKRQGYIKTNPCETVDKFAANYASREIFTEDEIAKLFPEDRERLLYIWQSIEWAGYFMVMKDTGWRPGEVAGLSKMNYYPEIRGVWTDSSVDGKTRNLQKRVKTTGKGWKFRVGFLSEQTSEVVEEVIRLHPNNSGIFQIGDSYIIPETANKHLKASIVRAGVEVNKRTQYSFRHTFQTYYLGRLPENVRLLLMGHTHLRNEYTHITAEQTLKRILEISDVANVSRNR